MGKYILALWMLILILLSACVLHVENPTSPVPLSPVIDNTPSPIPPSPATENTPSPVPTPSPVIEYTPSPVPPSPIIDNSPQPSTCTEIPLTPQEDLTPTSTNGPGITQSTPHVSPYIKVMVVDVEIRYLETNPMQIELVIRGTLPDQCQYSFYSVENRADQNVKVSLDGIHPADNSCLQTNQSIEYVLRLGRDMPELERGFPPGNYTLTVNNYQTSFIIK